MFEKENQQKHFKNEYQLPEQVGVSNFEQMKIYQKMIRNRMLIVDDEEFCISAMKAIFERIGINITQLDYCISGEESLN